MTSATCGYCTHREGTTCHRFPPALLPNTLRVWPTIALGDWCGEFNPNQAVLAEWIREAQRVAGPWWKFWGKGE